MNAPTDKIEALLAQLTLHEKCAMVSGADVWSLAGCDRLGIPGWTVSDGPVGVRGRIDTPALLAPSPSAMAATWDVRVVEALGAALGRECIDRDIDMLLAPTVNLHRSPRAGRHFEAFSEDPELTARVAVAYIRGVQSTGVGACVKHFVANDQEHERQSIDAQVDERTLREVYLRPFEAAVREAEVRAVMAAYNYVNGQHACAHRDLLIDILKGEWSFEGVVMSDWDAMKETLTPARNGLDIEMPGPGRFWGEERLEVAVEAGEVDESVLDDKVRRVLRFLAWRARLGDVTRNGERPDERAEHRALVRRAAADGMVLVKNNGLLPLDPNASVALIGPNVANTALFGGGSASLTPYRATNVLDAFTRHWRGPFVHVDGVNLERGAPSVPRAWIHENAVRAELYNRAALDGEPDLIEMRRDACNVWYKALEGMWPAGFDVLSVRLRFSITPDVSGTYVIAGAGHGHTRLFLDGELVTDNATDGFPAGWGLTGAESEMHLEADRLYDVVLEQTASGGTVRAALTDVGVRRLATTPEEMLADAERAAAAADVVVLVVGTTAQWETEGADRRTLALPAGQDELVRRVLVANARTVVVLNCGAPTLMPWLDDVPAALLAWYPGQEGGDAILDVITGAAEPGGRMPTTWARTERDTPSFLHYPGEAGIVRYGEELHVGYRWYDARHIEPLVPFGHGGSYTRFSWGEATVRGSDVDVELDVPVTNAGVRAGSEVVQIYVAPRAPVVVRPVKQLAGFAKVRVAAGQTEIAHVHVDARAFARWDTATRGWVVDPGEYDLLIAASARDVRDVVTWNLSETDGALRALAPATTTR